MRVEPIVLWYGLPCYRHTRFVSRARIVSACFRDAPQNSVWVDDMIWARSGSRSGLDTILNV